jgi:endonuclease/exonuclease/phosphatase family metal-dependent hydrolase
VRAEHAIGVFEWSVNRASKRRRRSQIEALGAMDADIVVLTEVPRGDAATEYLAALAHGGLAWGASSFDPEVDPTTYSGRRRRCVALASRWPLRSISPIDGAPWPERTIDAAIEHPENPIRILAIYAPLGSHRDANAATFEAAGRRLEHIVESVVVTGDFNAPRRAETVQ